MSFTSSGYSRMGAEVFFKATAGGLRLLLSLRIDFISGLAGFSCSSIYCFIYISKLMTDFSMTRARFLFCKRSAEASLLFGSIGDIY